MSLRRAAAFVALASVAVVAVACSGNDEQPASDGHTPAGERHAETAAPGRSPAATRTAAASPSVASASPEATAQPTASANNAQRGEARQNLLQGLERFDTATYHVVYSLEMTDETGESFTGSMAMAQDGAKSLFSMRLDSATEGTFDFAVIADGEWEYFCFGDGSGTEGSSGCLKSTPDDGNPFAEDIPLSGLEDELKQKALNGELTIESAPDQRIGAFDSRCYTVTEDSDAGTVCFAKSNGFLVLLDGAMDGGKTRLVAQMLTEHPDPSAFVPPYPVSDFGDFEDD